MPGWHICRNWWIDSVNPRLYFTHMVKIKSFSVTNIPWCLCCFLLLAFFLRLYPLIQIERRDPDYYTENFDSIDYLLLADHLIEAGTYRTGLSQYPQDGGKSWSFDQHMQKVSAKARERIRRGRPSLRDSQGRLSGEEEIFRAPGYPVFLIPFRWLCPYSLLPVMLAQVLISTGSCFLVWLFFRRLFPGYNGLSYLALGIQVFSVGSIIFASKLLSETLFTFCLLLLFLLLDELMKSAREKRWQKVFCLAVGLGILLGAACWIRAILLPMVPVFMLYTWWISRSWHNNLRYGVLAIFITLPTLILGVWILRNYLGTGYPGFASVMAVNMSFYYAMALIAARSGTPIIRLQEKQFTEFLQFRGELELSQSDIAHLAWENGWQVIREAPFTYLKIHLTGCLNNFSPAICHRLSAVLGAPMPTTSARTVWGADGLGAAVRYVLQRSPGLLLTQLFTWGSLALVYWGCLITLCKFKIWRAKPLFCLALIVVFYLLIIPGPISNYRFRVPVEPFLAIFAAYGLGELAAGMMRKLVKRVDKLET